MGRSFIPRRSVFRLRHVAQVHSKRHRKVENRRSKCLNKEKLRPIKLEAKKLVPIKLDENFKDVDTAPEYCENQDELISYEHQDELISYETDADDEFVETEIPEDVETEFPEDVETDIPEDLQSWGEASPEISTANNANCWSPARKTLADYPVATPTKPARSPQRVKWRGKQSCSTNSLVSISKYKYKSTIENAGKTAPVRDRVSTGPSILRNPLSAARQEHGMGKKKKNRMAFT